MLAIHLTTLSGTLLLYEGQEIGMINMPKEWGVEEYKDPFSIIHYKEMERLSKIRDDITMEQTFKQMQKIARGMYTSEYRIESLLMSASTRSCAHTLPMEQRQECGILKG